MQQKQNIRTTIQGLQLLLFHSNVNPNFPQTIRIPQKQSHLQLHLQIVKCRNTVCQLSVNKPRTHRQCTKKFQADHPVRLQKALNLQKIFKQSSLSKHVTTLEAYLSKTQVSLSLTYITSISLTSILYQKVYQPIVDQKKNFSTNKRRKNNQFTTSKKRSI